MTKFKDLLDIADILLGEKGCPWDKKQTISSIKNFFKEEAEELVLAIDKKDEKNIIEEAGDLLYSIIFLSKIAEMENKFSIKDIIKSAKEKLIRRHPHVFSDVKVSSAKDVEKLWNEIKRKEKAGDGLEA